MGVNTEQQPGPVRIEITHSEQGDWSVRSGDRYEDRLSADEALWCVVRVMTGMGVGFLRTAEQHAEWEAKYGTKEPLEPWQKQLPAAEQKERGE